MDTLKNLIRSWKEEPKKTIRIIAFGSSNTELHWHSLGHFNWFSWLTSSFREWVGRQVITINQVICFWLTYKEDIPHYGIYKVKKDSPDKTRKSKKAFLLHCR